jgi:hypothetical protein
MDAIVVHQFAEKIRIQHGKALVDGREQERQDNKPAVRLEIF